MNIAIIGAHSFVGKALQEQFAATQQQLHLFNRQAENSHEQTAYSYPDKPLDYRQLLDFEVIYYCAGAGVQPNNQDSLEFIYGLNAFEPIRLIRGLRDLNYCGKLVTFGSYAEIGIDKSMSAYSEAQLLAHNNPIVQPYAISKHILSLYIQQVLHNGLPFAVQHFILNNIYGKGENPNRLLPYLIRCCQTGAEIQLSSGEQYRQYSHIKDITVFLAQKIGWHDSGIFNLGDDKIISIKDLVMVVLAILEEQNYPVPSVQMGQKHTRDQGMKHWALDTQLLRSQQGLSPKITLRQGILSYLFF